MTRIGLGTIYPTAKIVDGTEVNMRENSFIGDFCFVSVPQLFLGRGAQVNSGTRIVGRKPVQIGDDATISYGCTLLSASDSTEARYMSDAVPVTKRIIREGPIGIGNRSFIGAHSIVMPGVQIVEGVVVRAFSYVNKPLLINDAVYGGQPARLVKARRYVET